MLKVISKVLSHALPPSISIDLLHFQINMFHHLLNLALGINAGIHILQMSLHGFFVSTVIHYLKYMPLIERSSCYPMLKK